MTMGTRRSWPPQIAEDIEVRLDDLCDAAADQLDIAREVMQLLHALRDEVNRITS